MYDYTVAQPKDWADLNAEVIVDPMIFRAGETFLAGSTFGAGREDELWDAVSSDLGSLVTFLDLLVLHDRLPAFNYADTFDIDRNFGDHLLNLVNRRVKVINHVDVQFHAYTATKAAALDTLEQRSNGGAKRLLSPTLEDDLAAELSSLEYRWNPTLGDLEHRYHGAAKVAASFLLGTLIFSAYAQQTGAPHVLSPKRSRLFTASALSAAHAGAHLEQDLYTELSRRFRHAGEGWRDQDLAWTPSFVPWLLRDLDPHRTTPANVLDMVFELRDKRSVKRYRETRAGALRGDEAARKDLAKLADAMTKELRGNRGELSESRNVLVEILPKAVGAAAGAVLGAGAGPAGAAAGAALGVAGEEALKRVVSTVWGFVFAKLPFVSARKLLIRAVRAEQETMGRLDNTLRAIWHVPSPR